MKQNLPLQEAMTTLVETAIAALPGPGSEEALTDFHIGCDSERGEVFITDDDGQELSRCHVDEWEELDDDELRGEAAKALRPVLDSMNRQKRFDSLNIFRPFSFVLLDADREPAEDLLVVDSDSIMVNEQLLENLDSDLDSFLQDLLSEP